ncbi:tRNA pseudouridine(55) synthase TruB [Enemella evansiae]|uniref:tRNA pseudouridine(55) synthase TruB n=1 Tax=Enemella evansiae TaxID=2016499 RepID=UPI000B965573|nr:tRNA pseudouridine(55) synthase TruB [Enemella evansiae]OYO07617.1 tRNA pseudouridine(55) synthase TruB [Enemella evansiae]
MTDSTESGLVVVDKPQGWTSHQIVGRCRRLLGTRKVGHAGTLDPMATGVLLVGVNRATRLLGHLMLTEKEYTATIRLGESTITDDAEGGTIERRGCGVLDESLLDQAMQPFRGDILQVPTQVSAIKIDGKRSYARVRAGEQVELKARPVTVFEFSLLGSDPAEVEGTPVLDLRVRVRCSSGTYIRALARDLGAALGCGGHLTVLRRTRVGPFGLDRAQLVDNETEHLTLIGIDEVAAECFPTLAVDEPTARAISYGQRLSGVELTALTAMLHQGRFLALYAPDGPDAKPEAVFS